jgi:hypothetical protein
VTRIGSGAVEQAENKIPMISWADVHVEKIREYN